ncbi:growth factor receptor-bound protein 14 isoform X3 [Zalophus californianus]|uniref:Growth factor receptor-bound protein 14 isoform X3 n=1 Tax=Zalophus californianus TaxID=9704 RepID=A0A6J2CUT7_ZALCA|nr:growth factor receptor-bound protein 14 isoform X3 [Zalophus californianus]
MTTSLQDGQSAAGRAAAQDSPLATQVCGAAQGRGDARDLEPAPWLHARALLPPPDGTRGCAADRRKKKDLDVLEMPSIPNPFPELCCSPFTSVLSAGLFPKANSRKKQVIKVYSEDETSRALEVPSDITARDVCQLLILKNHYIDDHSWTLFEHLPHIGLERTMEDHELVIEVLSTWGMEEENKLYFRKNYAKYEFFKNPMYFFPEHMVSFATETNGEISPTQILQMFLSSSTYPEIHGFLHAKEQGKKSWKKIYFLLRRSGLYFSTKGTSKEPRHLQFFSEFGNSDIYVSLAGKKKHGAPTNYGFCFKPNKAGGPRDLKMLCAEEEQSRTCWVTAIRLLKYGMQLYQNYMHPYQGRSGCSSQSVSPMSPTFLGYHRRTSDLYNGCQCSSPASAGFLPDTVFSENHRKLSILQLYIFKGTIFLISPGIHFEKGNKKKKMSYTAMCSTSWPPLSAFEMRIISRYFRKPNMWSFSAQRSI